MENNKNNRKQDSGKRWIPEYMSGLARWDHSKARRGQLAPQIYGIIKYRDLYLYSDIDLWWSEYSIAYFYLYTAKV